MYRVEHYSDVYYIFLVYKTKEIQNVHIMYKIQLHSCKYTTDYRRINLIVLYHAKITHICLDTYCLI